MKLNILFLICIFAIFTIAYSKKVDKAVFVATKHHTDDEDERVNEDKGTPSCKRKLAKLQTEQKFWKDKLSKVKAKINKKILKLQYKFEHKGKEEDSQEDRSKPEGEFHVKRLNKFQLAQKLGIKVEKIKAVELIQRSWRGYKGRQLAIIAHKKKNSRATMRLGLKSGLSKLGFSI